MDKQNAQYKKNAQILAKLRAKGQRLQSIDSIRGLSVCLMVGDHFFFDLVEFAGAPPALFSNPEFDVLHLIFLSIFLMLSGLSCRLSHSNFKRGLLTLAAAESITLVTYCMDAFWGYRTLIAFGILHLMACCMLFFAAAHKWLDRIPYWLTPFFYALMIFVTWKVFYMRYVDVEWLFPLGLISRSFYWSDYYPLFPWMFVFLLGTWLGPRLVEGRFPNGFYTFRFPLLAWVGRHALVIYLAHQPLLFGLTQLIIRAMAKN